MADRARKHHNELASGKEGSVSGSGGYDLPENHKNEIKKLVEDGVKNSMYFVWIELFYTTVIDYVIFTLLHLSYILLLRVQWFMELNELSI